jgi:ethanolamine utilization cobalamin adenosyltransferase
MMGSVYIEQVPDYVLSDDDIKSRVKNMGPFIRTTLLDEAERCDAFVKTRNEEIEALVQNKFSKLLAASHIVYDAEGLKG